MTTKKTTVEKMSAIQAEALELFRKKNADYGDSFTKMGLIGVLVRMEDKLMRAISVSNKRVELVNDETIRDTLLDFHNYAGMAIMLIDERLNQS